MEGDTPSQALDRFLAGVERRAFRMARIATGDPDEALDVVQEAMHKLVQRYRSHDETEWGPLFHRILQSRIRDWHRRHRVRTRWLRWFGSPARDLPGEAGDPLERIADSNSPDPGRQVDERRLGEALEKALCTLPLRQQQAFLLRAWEELDVAETARAMGCSEGSVKTHYSRAVHTLRELLKGYWP